MRRLLNGVDNLIDQIVGHGGFHSQLGKKIHGVFRTAIKFGMAFLTPETFDFRDGQALNADCLKSHPHFVQLEGLDDGDDEFHGDSSVGCTLGNIHQANSVPGAALIFLHL